jgi:hypothetical protein
MVLVPLPRGDRRRSTATGLPRRGGDRTRGRESMRLGRRLTRRSGHRCDDLHLRVERRTAGGSADVGKPRGECGSLRIPPGSSPDDRWLAVLPFHHVGGLSILWRSARQGSAVVLAGPFDASDHCVAACGRNHARLVRVADAESPRRLGIGARPGLSIRTRGGWTGLRPGAGGGWHAAAPDVRDDRDGVPGRDRRPGRSPTGPAGRAPRGRDRRTSGTAGSSSTARWSPRVTLDGPDRSGPLVTGDSEGCTGTGSRCSAGRTT